MVQKMFMYEQTGVSAMRERVGYSKASRGWVGRKNTLPTRPKMLKDLCVPTYILLTFLCSDLLADGGQAGLKIVAFFK